MKKKHSLFLFGRVLREHGFHVILDSIRVAIGRPYDPWLPDVPISIVCEPEQVALISLVHCGKTVFLKDFKSHHLISELKGCDLFVVSDGLIQPRNWQITSYNGIFAFRDLAGGGSDSEVYIGEDSFHFLDWLSSAPPFDGALDIGAGSGISSVGVSGKGNFVHALEISELSCKAIEMTAAINGNDNIEAIQGDITAGNLPKSIKPAYDLIFGNVPGVAVPPGIIYSPAGNGGESGLRIAEAVLKLSRNMLRPDGNLFLKFESLGTESTPFGQRVITNLVRSTGWSAIFTQHSRIPTELRAAISARWAKPHNLNFSESELLKAFDDHYMDLGAKYFYTCSVVINAERAGQIVSDFSTYRFSGVGIDSCVAPDNSKDIKNISSAYIKEISVLPDGVAELDVEQYSLLPINHLKDVIELAQAGFSPRQVAEELFARHTKLDPINSRALLFYLMVVFYCLK